MFSRLKYLWIEYDENIYYRHYYNYRYNITTGYKHN